MKHDWDTRSWVYILLCSDDSLYTGCTTNLELRMRLHYEGSGCEYTACRMPVELIWSLECSRIYDAIELERKIKKWSRGKKMALIRGDFKLLSHFAQSTEMKSRRRKRGYH
ncbi:MAG: GIY-YIG nuclease family protein [Rhodothermaceae bacterium]|nr:GIY-YIG nuclease family protein [Rhodothermaceae bacterium]